VSRGRRATDSCWYHLPVGTTAAPNPPSLKAEPVVDVEAGGFRPVVWSMASLGAYVAVLAMRARPEGFPCRDSSWQEPRSSPTGARLR
jgi:hypothetical protein